MAFDENEWYLKLKKTKSGQELHDIVMEIPDNHVWAHQDISTNDRGIPADERLPFHVSFYENGELVGMPFSVIEEAFGQALHKIETGLWEIRYSSNAYCKVTATPHHDSYDEVEHIWFDGHCDDSRFWASMEKLIDSPFAFIGYLSNWDPMLVAMHQEAHNNQPVEKLGALKMVKVGELLNFR